MLGINNIIRYKKLPLLFILLSIVLYFLFAYDLLRTDTSKLTFLYSGLFVCAYVLIKTTGFHFRFLVFASLLFRLVFLLAIPNLSQDFYRFIWDGHLLLSGLNPYLSTPNTLMENGLLTDFPNKAELFSKMGELSASNFSNYPPINQWCFALANLFPGKSILSSVIGLRLIIISADLGTLYYGKKLLEKLRMPANRIFWYILNPFIIIELTGNLHFEGVMVFFLVLSLYFLSCNRKIISAIVIALSISVKLIPLMFLPLFFKWFKKQNGKLDFAILGKYYAIVGTTLFVVFIPFISAEFISNYSETIGLWFGNFEFNASVYYLLREVGYAITGYNEIAMISKILPIISVLIILGLTFLKKNDTLQALASSMLLALSCYLFLSTTVHPWYITTLMALCIFTNYKFPLVWSFIIVLSYFAYANPDYKENLWIILLQYLVVFTAFILELIKKKTLIKPI
ncbi:putative hexosyltransferase [Winogradskyella alexanderae]|uniref:Mannosyltransferase n=1 Tax=Winogradskyella alexanderae TaxID=2877123 RepID=A0ABS7XUG4_9FLAO|nr:mannosyltransferase [Winogradskyella alexanderae]MCA0132547.1 mannosyltransferase [Winogradskyella alexanderae]